MKTLKTAWLSFLRSPMKVVLLIFVIVLSFLFLNIGIYQHKILGQSLEQLKKEYITFVQLDDSRIQRVYPVFCGNEDEEWKKQEERIQKRQKEQGENYITKRKAKKLLGYVEGLEEKLDAFHKNSPDVLIYEKQMGAVAVSQNLYPVFTMKTAEENMTYYDDWIESFEGNSEHDERGEEFMWDINNESSSGLIAARCIKVDVAEPVSFDFEIMNKTMTDEEIIKAIQEMEEKNKGKVYDSNGYLTTTGYFELIPEHSDFIPGVKDIKYLRLSVTSVLEDGSLLFEEGKSYLLPIWESRVEFDNVKDHEYVLESYFPYDLVGAKDVPSWCMLSSNLFNEGFLSGFRSESEGEVRRLSDKDKKQLKERYGLENDFEVCVYDASQYAEIDINDSEDIKAKKEQLKDIADYVRILTTNIPVVVTNDIDILPAVREQAIKIIERNETLKGKQIYISKPFAKYNNLSVGDTVSFKMDMSGFNSINCRNQSIERRIEKLKADGKPVSAELEYRLDLMRYDKPSFTRWELGRFNEIKEEDYVVAGIYDFHTDFFLKITNNFPYHCGNVLWLNESRIYLIGDPESYYQDILSEKGVEKFNKNGYHHSLGARGMMSVRLKNGREHIENYKKEMEKAGLSEYIVSISDSEGFHKVEAKIDNIQAETAKNIKLAIFIGVLMFAVFYLLVVFFTKSEIKTMALLGAEHSFKVGYLGYFQFLVLAFGFGIAYPLSITLGKKILLKNMTSLGGEMVETLDFSSVYILPFVVFGVAVGLSILTSFAFGRKKAGLGK